MSMIDTVRAEMMAAMKAKNVPRKNALSELLSALKAKAIDNKTELTEEEALAVVAREAKQMKETIESMPADRIEAIAECRDKLAVLNEFLPAQMEESEIRNVIQDVLKELGIDKPQAKDKGAIMKRLMPRVKGKADGKQVNSILATYFA